MAYGELIVYWADGSIQTYGLEEATTSIGRAPGNDIVLPTSAASRYHAHINVGPQGQVTLVDLGTVNGTFVNDELLQPDASYPLTGGEEIRIGDVRLVFHPAEAAIVQGEKRAMDETLPAPPTPANLLVTLDEPHQSVAPGARLQLMLAIENQTDEVRSCDVDLIGMDEEWAKANRYEVRLEGREKTEVLISVRPPRASDTHPGRYELVVKVTPHNGPEQPIEHTRFIDVVGYHGLGMTVRPGNQPDTFQVYIQNQGNVPARIRLGGWHSQRALRYDFAESRLTLAPGETRQVALRVRPRRGQSPGPTAFAVVARSLDASGYQAPVPAQYTGGTGNTGRSILLAGMLVPLLLAVVLGVAVIAVVVVFLGGDFLGVLGLASPTASAPDAEPTATHSLTAAPTPTRFPAPSSVEVSFDPAEVIRYEDTPIRLRYAIETEADIGAEELAVELVDEASQVGLPAFTVASLDGEVDLPTLLGPGWLSHIYADRNNTVLSYTLRVSARDSEQTSSPPASLIIQDLECSVSKELSARAGPGEIYPPAKPRLQPDESYWPSAETRVADVRWYQIQPSETERWLEATRLECKREGKNWQPPDDFRFMEPGDIPPTPSP